MKLRSLLLAALACGALFAGVAAQAQVTYGGNAAPAGFNNAIQYNASGILGGSVLSGDCTWNASTGVITCLQTNGTNFGNLATLGTIASGNILANATGSAANAISTTLSAEIDQAIGSTRGAILERGASGWTILIPSSTAGQALASNGTGADPSYQTISGGTGCTLSGGAIGNIVTEAAIQTCAPAANTTLTTGGVLTMAANGAASTPVSTYTGTIITGSATTDYPSVLYYSCAGAAQPTSFSTSGEAMGFNFCSGYTGNALHGWVAGVAKWSISQGGIFSGTTFSGSSAYQLGASVLWESATAATVTGTGLGTGPTVQANGSAAGSITAGTTPANATFTITLATAAHGWVCDVQDMTNSASTLVGQTSNSTTTAVFQAYARNGGATQALTAADVLVFKCAAY